MYRVVPERVVELAAKDVEDDPDNSFLKCLKAGQVFKDAGLTPMYILDDNFIDLAVYARETFKKKLH